MPKLPKSVTEMMERRHKGKVKVTSKKGQFVVEETGGTGKAVVSTSGAIPAGFPQDVPIYKETTVVSASKGEDGYSVSLRSNEAPDQVKAAYTRLLKAKGWTPGQKMPGMHIRSYRKGDRRCVLMVRAFEDGSQIQLAVIQK
jgi:hypothetical protein